MEPGSPKLGVDVCGRAYRDHGDAGIRDPHESEEHNQHSTTPAHAIKQRCLRRTQHLPVLYQHQSPPVLSSADAATASSSWHFRALRQSGGSFSLQTRPARRRSSLNLNMRVSKCSEYALLRCGGRGGPSCQRGASWRRSCWRIAWRAVRCDAMLCCSTCAICPLRRSWQKAEEAALALTVF